MRFREHRGGLEESLATTVEIPATSQGLRDKLAEILGVIHTKEHVKNLLDDGMMLFYRGHDARTGWETYIVTSPQTGVLGMVDGEPVEDKAILEITVCDKPTDRIARCHCAGYTTIKRD
jgi:hypothetical protein